jgi:hypothetical protein
MSEEWPLLGPAHPIEGFVEPMVWGRSNYTVIGVPQTLVDAAADLHTRRVGGQIEGVEVNLALTTAPAREGTFVWAGASLLRRVRLEAGDPVSGWLAPVDPDAVPVPDDVLEALMAAGARERWDSLSPSARRRHLAQIDLAATAATRAKRIATLVDGR